MWCERRGGRRVEWRRWRSGIGIGGLTLLGRSCSNILVLIQLLRSRLSGFLACFIHSILLFLLTAPRTASSRLPLIMYDMRYHRILRPEAALIHSGLPMTPSSSISRLSRSTHSGSVMVFVASNSHVRVIPNGAQSFWVIPNEETIHVPSIYISFDFNV
jgi:hypothetical protein